MRMNIGEMLTNRTRRDPHLEALVDTASGERFTYAEINARVNKTASMLLGMGVAIKTAASPFSNFAYVLILTNKNETYPQI